MEGLRIVICKCGRAVQSSGRAGPLRTLVVGRWSRGTVPLSADCAPLCVCVSGFIASNSARIATDHLDFYCYNCASAMYLGTTYEEILPGMQVSDELVAFVFY